MNSNERSLRTALRLVEFEVAQAGDEVSRASRESSRAAEWVKVLQDRTESTLSEVRSAMNQQTTNPALIDMLRGLYQAELQALKRREIEYAEAERKEQGARTVLTQLRNRDHSLRQSIEAEEREQRMERDSKEAARADDLWLQSMWSEKR